jgi:predicted RNase H-like HicB family nuclease
MEKLIIIVERSKDYFDAYAENCTGIYGAGETPEKAISDALKGLELYKKTAAEIPDILKTDYEIAYKYDMQSFLKHYSGILSLAGLERLTGVRQGLLSHYINGVKKPTPKTKEKISTSLHVFGSEIGQVNFV